MDYRCIHPIFEEKDRKEAEEFLIKRMTESATILGMDGNPMDKNNTPLNIKQIMTNMVLSMYGVNAVRMANLGIVQDTYLNYYRDHILRYLDILGIECGEVAYNPSSIVPYVLAYKSKDFGYFNPLSWFDPEIKWDLSYTHDPRRNLSNPLNAYVVCNLELHNLTNDKFIAACLNRCNFTDANQLISYRKQGKPVGITLNMLPDDNFERLQGTLEMLHKFI